MSKVARIGKLEEMDFAEEARCWPGICVAACGASLDSFDEKDFVIHSNRS